MVNLQYKGAAAVVQYCMSDKIGVTKILSYVKFNEISKPLTRDQIFWPQ